MLVSSVVRKESEVGYDARLRAHQRKQAYKSCREHIDLQYPSEGHVNSTRCKQRNIKHHGVPPRDKEKYTEARKSRERDCCGRTYLLTINAYSVHRTKTKDAPYQAVNRPGDIHCKSRSLQEKEHKQAGETCEVQGLREQSAVFLCRCGRSHFDPFIPRTVPMVLKKILISRPMLKFLMYSLSSLTISSKSLMSDLPDTCHIPVRPGFMARRLMW